MNVRKNIKRVAVVGAVVVLGGITLTMSADKASASPSQKCGVANLAKAGYVKTQVQPPKFRVAKELKKNSDWTKSNPYTYTSGKASYGRMELYWNPKTQVNCVVVYRTGAAAGKKGETAAYIKGSTGDERAASGKYEQYIWASVYSPGPAVVFGGVLHNNKLEAAWYQQ